jgi:hypothetical protein
MYIFNNFNCPAFKSKTYPAVIDVGEKLKSLRMGVV